MPTLNGVQIKSYGEYKNRNYGSSAMYCRTGNMTVYFSYETPIAFCSSGAFYIRENDWGPTTGKHLNWINKDKSIRIPGDAFETHLQRTLEKYGLA